MTYKEAQDYIASLAPRGWRLGLDRMSAFCQRAGLDDCLGQPGGPGFVHVAGTNGKGSATAFVQSILTEAGYRTGAFFSPFVYDPRERVQFGRELISEADLARITALLMPIAESFNQTEFKGITEFEFKTAVGFQYWKEMRCEWVALEVGLGGRLDSTNVVIPRTSVITSISLDHTNVLGATLEAIAWEKAGIIKPGVPVVAGQMSNGAMDVISAAASQNESTLWRLGEEITCRQSTDVYNVSTPGLTVANLAMPFKGTHMAANMALAIASIDAAGIDVSEGALRKGVEKAVLPGRFERRQIGGRTIILDGAHNAAAAAALADTFRAEFPDRKAVLLTSMVVGHDPKAFYEPLASLTSSAHFAPLRFHRALPPIELLEETIGFFAETIAHETIESAVECALVDWQDDAILLVTGSFYLLGEVSAVLQSL